MKNRIRFRKIRGWENSRKILVSAIAIFLLMTVMIGSFIVYYYSIKEKISVQIHRELKKANDLSLTYLRNAILSQKERMKVIASFCEAPSGRGGENWRSVLAKFNDDMFRLGVADRYGRLAYGVHEVEGISEKKYFKRACETGETVLSLVKEGVHGQDSLVIASPFYNAEEELEGVLCAEYTALSLGKILNTVETEGVGATLVVDRNGELVASYEGMEKFETVYDMLYTMELDSPCDVERLRRSIKAGESGYFVYYNNGHQPRLLYYQPAGIEDWTILSLVVTEKYQETVWDIMRISYTVEVVEIAAGTCVLLLILLILILRHRELEEGTRDFLTGVYDRKTAKLIFDKTLKKGEAEKGGCCIFLDIDHFKEVNDTMGHDAGDQILRQTANILKEELRGHDVISRYGGDEFCVWLWNLTEEEPAVMVADRLLNAFRSRTAVRISIGITFFGPSEESYEAVLKRADVGLYQAKKQGRDRYAIVR